MKNTDFRALVAFVVTVGAATVAAGCNLEPSVAGVPTYEADVKPILESRCIRCHGDPPLHFNNPLATPTDRFDLYECPAVDGSAGACTRAAKDVAAIMATYITAPSDSITHMPPAPAAPLSPYQIDTITKWAAESPPLER
jgi:hypothetical protein